VSKFLDHDAALIVMADKMAELKPRLRGWMHAGSIPFVLAAGIVLIFASSLARKSPGNAKLLRYVLGALIIFMLATVLLKDVL